MRPKAIAALLIFLILAGPVPAALGEKRSRYLYVSTYTLENRGEEPYFLTEGDMTVNLFKDNSWQTVRIRNSTHAVAREYIDDDGNGMAVLDVPSEISPHSILALYVTYEIEATEQPRPEIDAAEAGHLSDIPQGLVEEFCVETETFTAGDEAVQALARRLAANETVVLGVVSSLLEWITENVYYVSFEVPRYPNETLREGLGDCDDQAILLVTLCRALDIPALLQVGLVFSEGIESEKSSWGGHLQIEQRGVGWHGWALVYIPPWGWLPIDMTLMKAEDPLSRITEAPEYESYVVTCFNVSRQEYIGDSRRSRERLMDSDLYITVSDVGVEESSVPWWTTTPYVILTLIVGSTVVVAIIFLKRRRFRAFGEDRF